MNEYLVFGGFCLYVSVASLYLVLSGDQDDLLELFRRFWGRSLGHSLYFVANVALPLLVCVLCLGWGVRVYDATAAAGLSKINLQIDLGSCRDLRMLMKKQVVPAHSEIVYGA